MSVIFTRRCALGPSLEPLTALSVESSGLGRDWGLVETHTCSNVRALNATSGSPLAQVAPQLAGLHLGTELLHFVALASGIFQGKSPQKDASGTCFFFTPFQGCVYGLLRRNLPSTSIGTYIIRYKYSVLRAEVTNYE